MKILRHQTFEHKFELCDFVNANKVSVQQIIVEGDTYVLFYWEKSND